METATSDSNTRRKRASLSITGMSCESCAKRIEKRVGQIRGVSSVAVSLAAGKARIEYNPAEVDLASITEAIRSLGYDIGEIDQNELTPMEEYRGGRAKEHEAPGELRAPLLWPILMGVGGFILLGLFYVGIVGGTSRSLSHAFELLREDAPLVTAIAVGFGIQIGLYSYLRKSLSAQKVGRSSTAVAATGTGTSTVSMIACCAHHVADFLPLLGLASAGAIISEYRIPIMSLGLVGNGIGIILTLRLIWRVRRGGCGLDQHRSKEASLIASPPLGRSRQPIP